jgi:hypothetical protein
VAVDQCWIERHFRPLAYQGVASFNAQNGQQTRRAAEALTLLHYDVAVVVDSDASGEFSDSDAEELRAFGVHVARWDGSVSLEQRAFHDMSWRAVIESVQLACSFLNSEVPLQQVKDEAGAWLGSAVLAWVDEPRLRVALGNAAKRCKWFKQIGRAQRWARVIAADFDDSSRADCDLYSKVRSLREWIDRE